MCQKIYLTRNSKMRWNDCLYADTLMMLMIHTEDSYKNINRTRRKNCVEWKRYRKIWLTTFSKNSSQFHTQNVLPATINIALVRTIKHI